MSLTETKALWFMKFKLDFQISFYISGINKLSMTQKNSVSERQHQGNRNQIMLKVKQKGHRL